jgi:hypothetical protein
MSIASIVVVGALAAAAAYNGRLWPLGVLAGGFVLLAILGAHP